MRIATRRLCTGRRHDEKGDEEQNAHEANGTTELHEPEGRECVRSAFSPSHMTDQLSIRTVLLRGIRGRCPRCGDGPLFQRWIVTHERCSSCRLLIQRNYGDTWMFTNLMDRLPIMFGVAALFFGYRASGIGSALLFFSFMAVPMVATIKQRQGLALALDFLSRVYLSDPSDEIHGGREVSESEAAQLL